MLTQNYLFASEFVGLQIRATSPDGVTVVLWDNPLRNSPFAVVPLRMKFQQETKGANFIAGIGDMYYRKILKSSQRLKIYAKPKLYAWAN